MPKEIKKVVEKKTGTAKVATKPKAVQKTTKPATAARKSPVSNASVAKPARSGNNLGLSIEEMNSKAGQIKYLAAFMDVPQTKAREFMETYNLELKNKPDPKKPAAPPKLKVEEIGTFMGLSKYLAGANNLKPAQVSELFKSLSETIVQALKKAERFVVPGLGILTVKSRPRRKARNPQTGETIIVKAGKRLAFRVSGPLKKAVLGEK
jgi:DNA-binding protein HU-beta